MAYCYILYSNSLDKYYIGATHEDLSQRLNKHFEAFYKGSFASQTKDWELFFEIFCETYSMAINIERHIKKMKSRIYIENLKKYPGMTDKLRIKFKSI
jgi:putative endonuclease